MDASKSWHFAPRLALYQGRQSLSPQEELQIVSPLAPGQWANARIASFRDKMLRSEKVNRSENRAAGHWALRACAASPETPTPIHRFDPNGDDLLPKMRMAHEHTKTLAEHVRSGLLKSQSGQAISCVLHLGIGGSDIGPKLLITALAHACEKSGVQAEFVSNLDYHGLSRTLSKINPHNTLVVLASKSFTTHETMLNAAHVLQWMHAAGIENPQRNFIAVTQQTRLAEQWKIPQSQNLWMDESIGGRFSIWGPGSITARICLGNAIVDHFIQGGLELDQYFFEQPPQSNLAALLAMSDLYNLRNRKLPSLMVSAYDSRLEMLVPYLSQLWMESLGKHLTADGKPLDGPSCPILWGDVGTNAQHAFFQLLHQGLQGVAVELIGVANPDHDAIESHQALLAHLIAQAQALSTGNEDSDPQKTCWGGHPVNVMMLNRCDPASLGALVALWEHRVECMAALTGINPFDQWGVELGKSIAKSAFRNLQSNSTTAESGPLEHAKPLDEKSQTLVDWIKHAQGL